MQFFSDNWAGAAPEVMASLAAEARRYGTAYGDSALDREIEQRFSKIFEREVAVFFVGTGSAANGLAMAAVNRPGGVIFCHRDSHMIEGECGGVEFLTGGARLLGIAGAHAKIDSALLEAALAPFDPPSVHGGQPMAISITQQNEAGGIYGIAEITKIAAVAKRRGLPLHMDGARFANALVRLEVTPAEMTWKAGVDILSFGATKNGCIAAEALVFFDPPKAADAAFLRKRAGHLFSKSRFVAAQFKAYFEDDLWLRLARDANAMADRLRSGLSKVGNVREAWPTQGNEIFVVLRRADADRLRKAGATFDDWARPADLAVAPDETLIRLVAAFSTRPEDVDAFFVELKR